MITDCFTFCLSRVPTGPGLPVLFSLSGDDAIVYRDRPISYHERFALLFVFQRPYRENAYCIDQVLVTD